MDPFDQRTVFETALRGLGWVPGASVTIEYRYAQGDADRLVNHARELVAMPVDVLVARSDFAISAAKKLTKRIPIVMSAAVDPVREGFVASLSRPGGNVTGLTLLAEDVDDKQFELLHEVVPTVSTIAVLYNAQTRPRRPLAATAHALRMHVEEYPVTRASELVPAFAAMKRARIGAVVVRADSLLLDAQVKELASLAASERLPSMSHFRTFSESGGLMSYGADVRDLHRRSAAFVDKILRGATPANIPVEQPTKFELVINLKTAKVLGLSIPSSLLARADQVIE